MGHTPYGYRIVKGKAVIDEEAAARVKALYENYFSGMSLADAAKEAGIKVLHSGAKRMMQNRHYLGDDFYPALIDADTFQKAADEIARRSEKLGRDKYQVKETKKKPPILFKTGEIEEYYDNPIKQAEYLYSLIESETN